MSNLVAREIYRQVGGNTVYIHRPNIDDFSAADGLPRDREPLLLDVLSEKHMQMCIPVFLEFQDTHKIDALTVIQSREQYAHLSPALADVSIRSLTIFLRDAFKIKSQRRHFVEFSFGRYTRDCRAYVFQLRVTAAIATVGLTKKRLIAERPRFAFDRPDDREVTAPETLRFPQCRFRFPFPAVAINL